ncbi:PTS system cellobiose-specific transporter subunit IIA, partial [Streptococcus sobrinus DSM 20742 = ATCC 33478]
ESLDGEPVTAVILFAVRDKDSNTLHLKLLQKVAMLLADEGFIDKLHKVSSKEEFGTKRFQFSKILIIKPFKSIIKCEKRTKQNSDYQKTSFVRFLYLRSDFCPSLLK